MTQRTEQPNSLNPPTIAERIGTYNNVYGTYAELEKSGPPGPRAVLELSVFHGADPVDFDVFAKPRAERIRM